MKNTALFKTGNTIERIVLFLHGYGANGDDLLEIGKYWQNSLSNTLFIAPNAPYQHPQIPSGYMWFNFKDVDNITANDIKEGLNQIRPFMKNYLKMLSDTYKVKISHIIPIGFSQGAMIALDLLVHEPDLRKIIEYAGIYYPMSNSTEHANLKKALLVHGTDDSVVLYKYMAEAEKELTALGIHVKSITCHALGHSISPEGIAAGESFLKEN